MLIYDRKDTSIDIYSICVKAEKNKDYKKKIIDSLDVDELFYSLIAYRRHIAYNIMSKSNCYQPFYYSKWLELVPMKNNSDYAQKRQKEIIENYIEGEYDNLNIKHILKRISSINCKYEEHRLLLTEKFLDIRGSFEMFRQPVLESKNVIKLPKELYLLYLLQHGDFYKIPLENENELFSLLEIEYLKSVSIMDIKNMQEVGLLKGTLADVMNKAMVDSKILRKVKNKN